jgi:hypothetical protein
MLRQALRCGLRGLSLMFPLALIGAVPVTTGECVDFSTTGPSSRCRYFGEHCVFNTDCCELTCNREDGDVGGTCGKPES